MLFNISVAVCVAYHPKPLPCRHPKLVGLSAWGCPWSAGWSARYWFLVFLKVVSWWSAMETGTLTLVQSVGNLVPFLKTPSSRFYMLWWRNALLDLCRHELLFLTYGKPLISFGAPMLTQRTVQCHDAGCSYFGPSWKSHASGSFHMPLFTWRRAPIGRLNFISSESHVKTLGDVFSSSDLPSLGLVANHLPSANNWRIWPSSPNSVESKTLLPGWNSRFTSSVSFHMPLLCEISQTQVPERNFVAHLKKGPRKFWVSCQNVG